MKIGHIRGHFRSFINRPEKIQSLGSGHLRPILGYLVINLGHLIPILGYLKLSF